jgi:hypothetical protein
VHGPLTAADAESRQPASRERADAEAAAAQVPGLQDKAILAGEALIEDRAPRPEAAVTLVPPNPGHLAMSWASAGKKDWKGVIGQGGGMMFEQMLRPRQKARAVAQAAEQLDRGDDAARQALADLWDTAFEEGRLAALDEFQDRFCVCMKS